MKLKTFLRITAVTTALLGSCLILFPAFIANLFFTVTDHNGDIFIRFLGSSLIGYTYLNWHSSLQKHPEQLRPTLSGNLATLLIALAISLVGVIDGSLKMNGWMIVILHFIFAVGFSFYLFKDRS